MLIYLRITETYGKTQSLPFANKVWFQCEDEFHAHEGINTKLYLTGLTVSHLVSCCSL